MKSTIVIISRWAGWQDMSETLEFGSGFNSYPQIANHTPLNFVCDCHSLQSSRVKGHKLGTKLSTVNSTHSGHQLGTVRQRCVTTGTGVYPDAPRMIQEDSPHKSGGEKGCYSSGVDVRLYCRKQELVVRRKERQLHYSVVSVVATSVCLFSILQQGFFRLI